MVKFSLYLLIVVCCGLAGMVKASVYSDRVRNLQDMIGVFQILKTEMKYRMDPLPETFIRLASYKKDRACRFMGAVGGMLTEKENLGGATSLADAWNQSAEEVFKDSGLSEEDIFIVKDMAVELGKSGIAGQETMFARVDKRLSDQLISATADLKTKGRMYKSLGFAIGIVIVILLI